MDDISELSCKIIVCLLSMKRLNNRKFTLKQLANGITEKCSKEVKKYNYDNDNAEHLGCCQGSVSNGEYVLHILVYKDIFRQFPPKYCCKKPKYLVH
jgi:hypothetical protein